MKKIVLTTVAVVYCMSCFSQANGESGQTVDRNTRVIIPVENANLNQVSNKEASAPNKPQTISKRAGEPQRVHDETYYLEEIAKIDANILAIDQKQEYINSNTEEKAIAVSNGWFEKMAEIKSQLLISKEELQVKLNNLN